MNHPNFSAKSTKAMRPADLLTAAMHLRMLANRLEASAALSEDEEAERLRLHDLWAKGEITQLQRGLCMSLDRRAQVSRKGGIV